MDNKVCNICLIIEGFNKACQHLGQEFAAHGEDHINLMGRIEENCYALTRRGAGITGVHRSWWVALVDKSGDTDDYVNKGFLRRNRKFGGFGLASAYVLYP
jgi:hypothetical protein